VPGASDAKRGNEPSHSFKDLAARGAGSSLSSSSRAPGTSGGDSGGAHLRIETSEPAGSHSSSKNGSGSNGKDKGNKQLQDIRRMLNRKEEVSKSAGRTNSLIHQFEKQSSAAGAQRYGGGGGDSSDDDACHPNPNSGYNSSTRVSRVSSFDYDDDGEEDHEGQEVRIQIEVFVEIQENVLLAYLSICRFSSLFPKFFSYSSPLSALLLLLLFLLKTSSLFLHTYVPTFSRLA